MCIHCVEIQQGKYKSYDEFSDQFNPEGNDFDLDHYFDELSPIIESLKRKTFLKAIEDCTCGAKYTSQPKYHLKYCQEEP